MTRFEQITTFVYCFDEDMIPYKPKNSRTGCLPNLTHEPRKPVSTGTLVRSVCCSVTNIKMAGEILEDKDAMHEKRHYDATRGCGAGAAVTARLWEKLNGNPNPEGAQDCKARESALMQGDAYFGAVKGAVYWKKTFGIDSNCLIKNNSADYPKAAILERLNDRDRGTAVVATATVDGVHLMATGFKFSMSRPPNLLLSTAGSSRNNGNYVAHFSDEHDVVQTRNFPRPAVLNQYFQQAGYSGHGGSTLCDDHNHYRQGILDCCRNWSFSDGWLHHFLELVPGGTWVDMFYLCRYKGLSTVDKTNPHCTETLLEFTDRVLGYALTSDRRTDADAGTVDARLIQLPKKQLKRKPKDGGSAAAAAAAASSTRTKQHELVCKECVLLKESKGEPVEMSKMPKSSWYCDLCSDFDVAETKMYTTASCFAVHSPLKHGAKRKRGDPFCQCWERHVKRCHPHMQDTLIPDRCTSPTERLN